MFLACFSLTATSITLLVCSRSRYPSASWIFSDKTNSTGWSSDGFAFVLAVSNAVYAFLGTDCGAHLCEEIPNPGKNVPKVILYPVAMGLVTAFPFAVACMAAITDLPSVLTTPSGLPLIEIYYQGTGSHVGTTILMVLFAVCLFGCAVAIGTTSSRTMWAISRDGALPFSRFWMQVSPRFEMPVNAVLLSATVVSVRIPSRPPATALTGVLALWSDLSRLCHRLLSHDRCCHSLPSDHLRHPSSHPPLPGPRQSPAPAILFPWQIRNSHQHHRCRMGPLPGCGILYTHRYARNDGKHELRVRCHRRINCVHYRALVHFEAKQFHRAADQPGRD